MQEVTIKHNQSLLDLSIQSYGTIAAIIEMAALNDVSISDELIEGSALKLSEFENERVDIIDFYNKNQIKPVTALTDADFAVIELESCNLCNCFK